MSMDIDAREIEGLVPGEELPKRVSPMVELGATGLKRTAGYVDEEFLPQLRGRKSIQVFREMRENDPIVGALLFALDRLLREVEWRVEPPEGTSQDNEEAGQFLEECMEDMSHTWDDFISEVLSMIVYGWSWHEIVYKKRVGPWEKSPTKRSKYTDGRIGWRKMPIRAQETWNRWLFDDEGGLKGMVQLAPPYYTPVPLPIDKCLLFRTTMSKGNPEGRSMLRNAYRPWYMKKRLEEIEGIGIERDLAGMPVGRVPSDYLQAAPGTKQYEMVQAFRKMVRSVRRDEQEGIILPTAYDQDTKQPLFDFELLSAAGTRQYDTDTIIRRYEERILMTVLADFILVGHQSTGSYALHTDKSGMFRTAINSLAQSIADVMNRHAIPRLFAVNGWKLDQLPTIVPNDVDPPDLTQLGAFMGQLSSAGVNWFPDPELEKFIRDAARLPKLDEQSEQAREAEMRQAEIMRIAEQRMSMLQMQQQAVMGEAQMAQGIQGMDQGDPEAEAGRTDDVHQLELASREQKMRQSDEVHGEKLKAMKTKAPPPGKGKK